MDLQRRAVIAVFASFIENVQTIRNWIIPDILSTFVIYFLLWPHRTPHTVEIEAHTR